jgi:hypothetical protein
LRSTVSSPWINFSPTILPKSNFSQEQFFAGQFSEEEFSREEFFGEESSEVSVSYTASLSWSIDRSKPAHKLGRFVVHCLSLLLKFTLLRSMTSTSQQTRNDLPQVLNNFLLVKLLSLARLELGLLASKEIFSKFDQK